jgi:hypothetical protein
MSCSCTYGHSDGVYDDESSKRPNRKEIRLYTEEKIVDTKEGTYIHCRPFRPIYGILMHDWPMSMIQAEEKKEETRRRGRIPQLVELLNTLLILHRSNHLPLIHGDLITENVFCLLVIGYRQ